MSEKIFITLIDNAAILLVLGFVYSQIFRFLQQKSALGQVLNGLLFGTVALAVMLNHLTLMPGAVFDTRSVVLSVGGLFGGPLVGLVSFAISAAFRIWQGGVGALTGVLVAAASAGIGTICFFLRINGKFQNRAAYFYLFGLFVHLIMLLCMLSFPRVIAYKILSDISLPVMLIYPVITCLLCLLISDREKRLEEQKRLIASEEKYRNIVDTANEGIWIIDDRQKTTFVNNSMAGMLGYLPEDMLDRPLTDFVHPDELPDHEKQMQIRKSRKASRYERRMIKRDGSTIWTSVSANPVLKNGLLKGSLAMYTDITERKQAEDLLLSKKHYLSTILQTSADAFWVLDINGRVIEVNQACCVMNGYTREELLGRNINELDALETSKETKEHIKRIIANGSEIFETMQLRKDGTTFPVEVSATYLDEDGGQFVCFGRDQSSRKRNEEKIALQSRMLDEAPASITIHDTAGNFLYANRKTLELHGYDDLDEFLKINLHDLDLPESKALLAERFRKIEKEGEATFEASHYRKDCSSFPLEVTAKKIQWMGRPAVLSIADDISERKQAEEELHRQRQRQSSIIEGANAGTWEWNVQTGEIITNERWAGIIGYTLGELAPTTIKTWIENTHPEDIELSNQRLEQHFDGELDFYDCECRKKHKDGHWVWVMDRGKLISRTDDGEPLWMFGTHTDITELKMAEEEQAKLHAQLAQTQKMDALGSLASGIAHDFNNLLAAILGYSEIIEEELPADSQISRDMGEIVNAASKAKTLVRRILTFSRESQATRKAISIADVLHDSVSILNRTIPKMICMDFDIAPDVWPVKADSQQIEQIVLNLVGNAADALDEQGTITVTAKNSVLENSHCDICGGYFSGDYVVLSVKDTGGGMDPEVKARIFDPFFTTKEVGRGTGLGLATVYGIVTSHNGHLVCHSKKGQGTAFLVYLPRAEEDVHTISTHNSKAADPRGSGVILVVDDESTVRNIAKRILTRNGYEVIMASSGEEALGVYNERSDEIDLVLMDLGMPGMGGKACLVQIRQMDSDAKVLIASGYIQYELTDELEALGATGMVSKPYRKADILKAVNEALGH